MSSIRRTVLWRNLVNPGVEYCTLSGDGQSWQLNGTALAALDSKPIQVIYDISCDEFWRTREARIELRSGTFQHALWVAVDDKQRWKINGEVYASLLGCFDLDLGISPSTNTFPIRRLSLTTGSSQKVVAAWVPFPDLSIQPLLQKYTRLDEKLYRYESASFVADIQVDDLGLVTRYAGGWDRVGSTEISDD